MTNCRKSDKSGGDAARLRVCLVSPVPPPFGGMGHWTTLIHRWVSNDSRISIAQVDTSPRWRAIDDLSVWKRVLGGGMQLLRNYGRFLKSIRGADVVHLATSGRLATVRDLVICATARLRRVPVVYHLHFGRICEIACSNNLEWRMLLLAMKMADVVLALDGLTAAAIRRYLPNLQVEVMPNPIDLADLPAPELPASSIKTALFLGWILPGKGVEELLRAWSACAEKSWELVLAGPVNPAYREKLVGLCHPCTVRFVGELPHEEAMYMMARCDLFILPSHTEAFPYVVLEAMALSKPVVATSVGAIPEMLAGECGVLTPPEDTENLARAIKHLVCDEKLRLFLGTRAREKATRQYSLGAVMEKMATIWQSSSGA